MKEVYIPRRYLTSDEAMAAGHRPVERRDDEEVGGDMELDALGPVRMPLRQHPVADHIRTSGPVLKAP